MTTGAGIQGLWGICPPSILNRYEKVYLLDDLSHDGERWREFVNEVFHYTIRISDTTFS